MVTRTGRPRFGNALSTRTSPNGVFGLKTFPSQMMELQGANPRLVGEVMRLLMEPEAPRKVIELRRRDRDAHTISYARANLSGIWRVEQEERGAPSRPTPQTRWHAPIG